MDAENALPLARAGAALTKPQTQPQAETNRTLRVLLYTALAVQGAHLLVMLLATDRVKASNVLQTAAPLLCVALCLYQAQKATAKHQGKLWVQLSAAFLFWAVAQGFYLAALFSTATANAEMMSDIFWLAFAFPILLVAAHPSRSLREDPVGWLDTAQSGLLFCILFVLVYPHPGILKPPLAYHVEDFGMLLAVALRYSVSKADEERLFYRNIVVYTVAYNVCSLTATLLGMVGVHAGTMVDLCWSIPFTAFSAAAVSRKRLLPEVQAWLGRGFGFPTHLHGISALGMAVMSLAGSAVLARYNLAAGIITLIAATLLFATRTSTREWQLHAAHARLQHTALHDPLTGLANRSLLKQELDKRLHRKDEQSRPWAGDRRTCLLFIDLDRFKIINDGLGHAFGDLLLIRVAELIRAAVRPGDIVGRHGGDEFVVLLDQVEEAEAEALGQRVNELLREPMRLEDRLIHITASIGLVMSEPGATADSMLQDADCAMYKAKGAGKNRAQTFAPNMLAAAKRKLGLETDLRATLSDQAIEVQYQPIYKLNTAQTQLRHELHGLDPAAASHGAGGYTVLGFEALARWGHPQRGMVPPADFIPIAEDTGLIIELGKQVLYQACCQCHNWNRHFKTRLTVSVNVSALQFSHPGLLDEIKAILNASGLDPRLLKLEITESVLLSGYDAVEEVLIGARALGIGICLDDFGTGYSSLSYLLRLPFDVLKIDRSFVRHLDSDHRRAEMVRMVIQLAATLKKKIVAEGIESPAELAQLRVFGCDMVQGFLLSRPLAPTAIEQMLHGASQTMGAAQLMSLPDKVVRWELDASAMYGELPSGSPMHERGAPPAMHPSQ